MSETKFGRAAANRREHEIWQACDELHSQNLPVTYMGIEQQLVKCGFKKNSNADLRKYLKSWQKNQLLKPKVATPIPESEPINEFKGLDFPITPVIEPVALEKPVVNAEGISLETLLSFYQHHLDQFDRLLKVIDLLKKENAVLRSKIPKPRIVCRA